VLGRAAGVVVGTGAGEKFLARRGHDYHSRAVEDPLPAFVVDNLEKRTLTFPVLSCSSWQRHTLRNVGGGEPAVDPAISYADMLPGHAHRGCQVVHVTVLADPCNSCAATGQGGRHQLPSKNNEALEGSTSS
jgi:hypothetical protein